MHNTANCSSSSSPGDPDDFSLFLHQIMLRSSSSSSTFTVQKGKKLQSFGPPFSLPENQDCALQPTVTTSGPDRIPIPKVSSSGGSLRSSVGGGFASPRPWFQESCVNVTSSSFSVGNEYDCETEGLEGVEEEEAAALVKPNTAHNSSKRSRAAEDHNLSEKRRRSRINEKMKALQNLIPNSNKTDKASMLDEAIEYLKQLQLQVQLLTVRNGLSTHPICLPGVVQSCQVPEMRMGCEGIRSLSMSLASGPPMDPANPTNNLLNLADNYNDTKQASVVDLSKLTDSDYPFVLESATNAHHGPVRFPLPGSSKGTHIEEKLHCQQGNQDLSRQIQ